MTDEEREALERFWQLIRVNEDYIRQYANAPCPDAADRWDKQLEDAYERIRPILHPLAHERFFFAPADLSGPFLAETAHQALMFFLNPPELLFARAGALKSPEYGRIRQEAEQELRLLQSGTAPSEVEAGIDSPGASSAVPRPAKPPDLTEAQQEILEAVDGRPRRGPEIAKRSGWGYDGVRRHLPTLVRMGLVKKTRRGYHRM